MRVSRQCTTELLIACLMLPIAGPLVAADWPQWRGPNRDASWNESGIISSFPSTGLDPKWKVPAGFGYSSPVVSNGKLYQGDLVRAQLSPAGYRELGRVHLFEPTSPLFENKFAWAAPAFANRNIYVRNDRELRCYSLEEKSDRTKRGNKN